MRRVWMHEVAPNPGTNGSLTLFATLCKRDMDSAILQRRGRALTGQRETDSVFPICARLAVFRHWP